jgi:hypothetical protein
VCEEEMLYKNYETHVQTTCIHRETVCNLCKKSGSTHYLEVHKQENCEYTLCTTCNDAIPKKDKNIHTEEDCPLVMVSCLNKQYGCTKLIKRKDLHVHHSICKHTLRTCEKCCLSYTNNQTKFHNVVCSYVLLYNKKMISRCLQSSKLLMPTHAESSMLKDNFEQSNSLSKFLEDSLKFDFKKMCNDIYGIIGHSEKINSKFKLVPSYYIKKHGAGLNGLNNFHNINRYNHDYKFTLSCNDKPKIKEDDDDLVIV